MSHSILIIICNILLLGGLALMFTQVINSVWGIIGWVAAIAALVAEYIAVWHPARLARIFAMFGIK